MIFSGEGMWESNPPGTLLTPHTGFEDQEAHQSPIYPHIPLFMRNNFIIFYRIFQQFLFSFYNTKKPLTFQGFSLIIVLND